MTPAPFPKTKAIILTLIILILLSFGIFWFYFYSNLSSLKMINEPQSSVVINEHIAKQKNAFPQYVLWGTLNVGKKNELSTYKLELTSKAKLPLVDNDNLASGFLVKRGEYLTKIDNLEDAKQKEFLAITYLRTKTSSTSGKVGYTILGIADFISKSNGDIVLGFLDDSAQKKYILGKDLEFDSEDREGSYSFNSDLRQELKRGSTIRILVDDKEKIISATILAPVTTLTYGLIDKIYSIGDEFEIKLAGKDFRFVVNKASKIIKRGELDNFSPASVLKEQMKVYIVYYALLDKYYALAMDYE